MLSSLRMYGLDRQVCWNDQHIALGGNFKDSLPEDRFDLQPLWSEDRSACLVADIRLDNRADLARDLGLIHPEELSDSAFLMAAWLRWGSACLDHLLGGFAFAVWMPGRQELFAARDHAGERPLFYHRGRSFFALASMPKGLLGLPGLPRGFPELPIAAWLTGTKPGRAWTFFEGIQRLPPGHFLRITPNTFECRQYWHPANARPTRYQRDEEYAEALLELLDRATEARLRSILPVGSFLSAGFDSASVTASAARLLAAKGKRLTAFTSVPRPDFNGIVLPWLLPSEREGAAEVARLYPNIEHVILDSRGYDLLGTMRAWTDALDEPALNPVNMLWITAILDQARQRGIGVMLEGSVGNGTISWNSWGVLGHYFVRGHWARLARNIHALRSRGELSLKGGAREATRSLFPLWLSRALVPQKNLESLFDLLVNPEWMHRHDLKNKIFESIYRRPSHFSRSNLIADQTYLLELFDPGPFRAAVQAVTRMELRDPAADKRIYDFCFSIPREQFIAGGYSRSLVRRTMKQRLPQSTITRRLKGTQSADWYLPMTESLPELRRELSLIEQSPAARRALDLPAMQALFDNWPQSGFHTYSVSRRWHLALSRAISMGYFLRSHESAAPSLGQQPAPPSLH